jgi:PiT family inorganic phosphate transporter
VAGDLLWAWILTIPCSAFIAAIAWGVARVVFAS